MKEIYELLRKLEQRFDGKLLSVYAGRDHLVFNMKWLDDGKVKQIRIAIDPFTLQDALFDVESMLIDGFERRIRQGSEGE